MQAKVTIGITAHNEAYFIRAAILSALEQGVPVILSDNASSDGTQGICTELAQQYPAVRYVRHESNMGALRNFRYCMEAARTPYFMWLGAHDLLPTGYVDTLSKVLDEEPDAVLAYGAVQYIDIQGYQRHRYEYRFAELLSSPEALTRITALVSLLVDCGIVHGVFRREALEKAWFDEPCIGVDHVLLTRAALH